MENRAARERKPSNDETSVAQSEQITIGKMTEENSDETVIQHFV